MTGRPATIRQADVARVLRAAIEPRGLSRDMAAAYVGVSATKFDELVRDRRMPKPRCIDARKVWDRRELDAAFDDLPKSEPVDEWEAAHGED